MRSDDVIMRGGESGEFSSEQLRIESGDSPDARRAARGLTVAEESGVSGTGGMVAAADDVAAFPEAGAVVVRLRSANKMPPAAATATLIAAVVVPSRVAMGGRRRDVELFDRWMLQMRFSMNLVPPLQLVTAQPVCLSRRKGFLDNTSMKLPLFYG